MNKVKREVKPERFVLNMASRKSSTTYLMADCILFGSGGIHQDRLVEDDGTEQIYTSDYGTSLGTIKFFSLQNEYDSIFESLYHEFSISGANRPMQAIMDFATSGRLPACIPKEWLQVLNWVLSSKALTRDEDRAQYEGISNVSMWAERFMANKMQGKFEALFLLLYCLYQDDYPTTDIVLVFNSEDGLRTGRFHSIAEIAHLAYCCVHNETVDEKVANILRSIRTGRKRIYMYVHKKGQPYKRTKYDHNNHFSIMVPVAPPTIPYTVYGEDGLVRVASTASRHHDNSEVGLTLSKLDLMPGRNSFQELLKLWWRGTPNQE